MRTHRRGNRSTTVLLDVLQIGLYERQTLAHLPTCNLKIGERLIEVVALEIAAIVLLNRSEGKIFPLIVRFMMEACPQRGCLCG